MFSFASETRVAMWETCDNLHQVYIQMYYIFFKSKYNLKHPYALNYFISTKKEGYLIQLILMRLLREIHVDVHTLTSVNVYDDLTDFLKISSENISFGFINLISCQMNCPGGHIWLGILVI